MATTERKKPLYQNLNGCNVSVCFHKEIFLSSLDYKPKPGELFIASYPKCGTTWTQMIVFLIRNKGKPATGVPEFYRRMAFLEMFGSEDLQKLEGAYATKTHLPFDRVPYSKDAKYIYVTRNPKDNVVSFFHHTRSTAYLFEDGEFDVFFDLFMEGKVDYGDYFDHVLGWYEHRNDKNVLFITYEELKADTRGMIVKIARFMGEEYEAMFKEDPQILENVLKYSSIEEMKRVLNKSMDETVGDMSVTAADIDAMPIPFGVKHVRKFMIQNRKPDSKHLYLIRKGIIGDWKGTLTPEQADLINKKTKDKLFNTELYSLWKGL